MPRPRGSVPVRLAAGASQLLLSLPSGVPARVTAAAGAGEISLYGQNHTGVPGGSVFTTPTWAPGKAGFDIDAIAGAAKYLVAHGVQQNVAAAIFAYNHADWYVQLVEALSAKIS